MPRRTNSKIEAAAFKQAHDIVDKIQPIWTDSMTAEQAAIATKSVILTTLHEISRAAQQTLALEGET